LQNVAGAQIPLFCRVFATHANTPKQAQSPLQGGGRWFESSIAHFRKSGILQVKRGARERTGVRFLVLTNCNPSSLRGAPWRCGRVRCEEYEKDGAVARLVLDALEEEFRRPPVAQKTLALRQRSVASSRSPRDRAGGLPAAGASAVAPPGVDGVGPPCCLQRTSCFLDLIIASVPTSQALVSWPRNLR
jgi:hypothetical protein